MEICIPFLSDCGWGKHPGLLVLTEQNIFLFLMAVGHGNCVRPRRFYFFYFFIIFCGKKFKHQNDIQMEQKTSALTCRASEA